MTQIEAGHKYKITNVKGGTVVDVSGVDNKTIIGYGYHDGANQQWETERSDAGWRLKNVGTGLYLGLEDQPRDGLQVLATQNALDWQIWEDEKDNSVHRLFVPNTTQNLDLANHGNSTPGTPVTIWSKWDGQNQTWRFEPV